MIHAAGNSLAEAVLGVHLLVIAFNVGGLIAIPLGAWRGWRWVRGFWWRTAHLASLAVVAGQALAGRACFLTLWQFELEPGHRAAQPLIAHWIDKVLFWPLPLWFFAALYTLVWLYVLGLWWWVRPRSPWSRRADGPQARVR